MRTLPKPEKNMPAHSVVMLLYVLAGMTACAMVRPEPPASCGARIDARAVHVVDLRSYQLNAAQINETVQKEVGAFRLVTEEPIWVPDRYSDLKLGNIDGIADARALSASWGCNLLLVLDTRRIRSGPSLEDSKQERSWLIHVGTRGGSG